MHAGDLDARVGPPCHYGLRHLSPVEPREGVPPSAGSGRGPQPAPGTPGHGTEWLVDIAPGTEAAPVPAAAPVAQAGGIEAYSVKVNGQVYDVEVGPSGQLSSVTSAAAPAAAPVSSAPVESAEAISAPLAGNIFKVVVQPGHLVAEGDVLVILEAMKMETEVRAVRSGVIQELHVKEGDSVSVGSPILSLA